jgi:hypothetical protein
MDQRDDYADLDLPPERRSSWLTVGAIVVVVIVLTVVIGLRLLARVVAARMDWN